MNCIYILSSRIFFSVTMICSRDVRVLLVTIFSMIKLCVQGHDYDALLSLLHRCMARLDMDDFTANVHGNLEQKGYTKETARQMSLQMPRVGGSSCQCTCCCRNRVRANQTRRHCTGGAAGRIPFVWREPPTAKTPSTTWQVGTWK